MVSEIFREREHRRNCSLLTWHEHTKKQIRCTSETLTLIDEYKNFFNAHMEAAAECIPTKLRAKYRVPWDILAVKEKRDDVKTASLFNKRNPTNANTQKLKKTQSEQILT